jgi:hypothetical protein
VDSLQLNGDVVGDTEEKYNERRQQKNQKKDNAQTIFSLPGKTSGNR